jgi:hypothetical protein
VAVVAEIEPMVALVAVLLPETTVTNRIGATLKRLAAKSTVIVPVPLSVPDSIAYGKYRKPLVKSDAFSTSPLT